MEARICRFVILATVLTSLGAGFKTPNFVVEAPTPELAERIGIAAERYRKQLAIEWLGKPLRDWSQPCPISASVAPHLGAGGETSFLFDRGEVYGWKMKIFGSEARVLDSVLPHEVTHTIFATHFRQPLPRWADEGACTTVEHVSEKSKQHNLLINFLQTNRGIAFGQMFAMREYPADVLPLYAQGFSLARYLIDQGGKRKFVEYIGAGLEREQWAAVTKKYYGHANLADLQTTWLNWVKQGSPLQTAPGGDVLLASDTRREVRPKSDLIYRAQNGEDSSVDVTSTPLARNPAGRQRIEAADADSFAAASGRSSDTSKASAFDRQRDWGASRDLELASTNSRGDSDNRLAMNDRSAANGTSTTRRTSVYDRGIEPSSSSAQRPLTAGSRAEGASGSPPAERSRSANSVTSVSDSRRVVLEWNRDHDPLDVTW
ncbi:MAG: hypothetical protein SGJ20_05615 [Planctomycetota bacterium]|nr:hypothetical protein [Planctomycetota bacterium]